MVAAAPALDLYPGERVWFARPPALDELEVLYVRDSARLWRQWHDTYTLCVVYKGGSQSERSGAFWRYRGADLTICPGEVMLMEPGELHVTKRIERGPASFDTFFIQPRVVDELKRELELDGPLHLREAVSRDPRLVTALSELALRIHREPDALSIEEGLLRVLWLLLSQYAEEQARRPEALTKVQVKRVREYFDGHYADRFDLDEIAAACRVSKSSICHGLPRWLGVTPRELRTLVRARHAKELLRQQVPPAEVAILTGFADQPQLTRHFKQLFGVSPGRYARMVRISRG